MKPFLLSVILLLTTYRGSSQRLNFAGAAASLGYVKGLNRHSDLTLSLALKERLQPRTIESIQYKPRLLEYYVQALYTIKRSEGWLFGFGYGFQRNNPFHQDWRNEHRLVQQAQVITRLSKIRLYNRFRLEERLFYFPVTASETAIRIRWQPGLIIPLNKGSIHVNNEFYLIPSRYRNAFYSENWLYAGYAFKSNNSGNFEMGAGINSVVRNLEGERLNLFLLQFNWTLMQGLKNSNDIHMSMRNRHF